ncbi:MAG TPA: hypothetical protein PKA90_10485 [Ignavibacteria bacterium]|nr:hypothetical protein [Ignavibacteria bacterium]HMR40844.1 hypothetical protein [Ignavibacteria bacterium]
METGKYSDTLSEIKNLMERSSRLTSLSGLSAIAAGVTAIAGSFAASIYTDTGFFEQAKGIMLKESGQDNGNTLFLIVLSFIILLIAVATSIYFSSRNAKKQGKPFWNIMSKRVFANHFIFLLTGGIFCSILLWYGIYFLIVPAMLFFYGLALVNISKFTFNEAALLGVAEICLGILSSVITVYPILMWMIGFGLFHLIFGVFVYIKYDKGSK